MSEVFSIGIAGIRVARTPHRLRTTLGSCIGIALYDRVGRVAGLAHVMLPESNGHKGDRGKFADTGVDWLLEQVLEAGASRGRLAAKLAGGASMFGAVMDNGLGERNARAVRERLGQHGIRVVAEHVGGEKGRRMLLDPANGEVTVQIIGAEPTIL
ncbi:MAG: chemotaxis protein CheD [Phycisphaerales bacterium]|nr:chemotaxis protein CheD [Phycisphaerales bacterium]